jgi:putative aldouronate transport system substrate-binding protein
MKTIIQEETTMVKSKITVLPAALVLTLAASLLTGCGKEKTAAAADETTNLVMYVIGDRPAGQDKPDAHFNELIKDKINCTLTVNWIPWADFTNKYPLLFSSGEEFDMAYTAAWLNFTSLAQKGAFRNLDELWPKYAPKNFARQSEAAKQEATVDGHYCCVPTLLATYTAYGPIYRTDIMEGTGWNGKMDTFADIEAYCDIVKKTHPEIDPIDIYAQGSEWDDTYMYSLGYRSSKNATNDFLFYDPQQKNPKIITYYECNTIPQFLDMMARWNKKGFFTKSALADTDSTKTQNGKAALRTHNIDTWQGYAVLRPEWKFKYQNMNKYVTHLPFTQDAMVISNTSKNPEKAMELWELITNDREVFDAFFYGILGTTYSLNDKGEYKILDPNLYALSDMWAARTIEFTRNGEGTPDDYQVQKEGFETFMKTSPEAGHAVKFEAFSIDTSKIETEYAACQNVHQQYWWPLELGYTDAEKGLAEYKSVTGGDIFPKKGGLKFPVL